MARVPSASRTRVAPLDGLRGVALVVVLTGHLWPNPVVAGAAALDAFFVLSGFLIMLSLLKLERGRQGVRGMVEFWAGRIRRIMPVLLTTMLVLVFFFAWAGSLVDRERDRVGVIATLLQFQNYSLASRGLEWENSINPLIPAWSLSVEEHFYIAAAIAVLLVVTLLGVATRRTGVALALGCALGAAGSFAWLYWEYRQGGQVLVQTHLRMGPILLGSLAAVLVHYRWLTRLPRWVTPVAALVFIAAIPTVGPEAAAYFSGGGLIAAAASCALVVDAWLGRSGPVMRALSWRPLAAMGAASYAPYLWHMPLYAYSASAVFLVTGVSLDRNGAALVATIATVVLSVISYRFVEVPARTHPKFLLRFRPGVQIALGYAGAVAIALLAAVVLADVVPPVGQ